MIKSKKCIHEKPFFHKAEFAKGGFCCILFCFLTLWKSFGDQALVPSNRAIKMHTWERRKKKKKKKRGIQKWKCCIHFLALMLYRWWTLPLAGWEIMGHDSKLIFFPPVFLLWLMFFFSLSLLTVKMNDDELVHIMCSTVWQPMERCDHSSPLYRVMLHTLWKLFQPRISVWSASKSQQSLFEHWKLQRSELFKILNVEQ